MSNFLKIEDIETIVELIEEERVFFENKKIAISGAFGFIGKYILESLLLIKKNKNFNISIYAIDNFITSNKNLEKYYNQKGIKCINHDINNKISKIVENRENN